MTSRLDDEKIVAKLDPGHALEAVAQLGEQVASAWRDFKKVSVPKSYRQINKIVLNGMGGSQLGAHLLSSVYFKELQKPFVIVNSYELPGYIDNKTLYIVSSYSGNTEEPLATIAEARRRGAKIFGIAAGGKLGQLITSGKIPGFVFDPVANPSGQPRLGLGYSLTAQLALFNKLGLLRITDFDIKQQLALLKKCNQRFGFSVTQSKNPAKKMALALAGNAAVIVASEHLVGTAHIFANQTNETGKTFSTYYAIPELNHHLLESLKNPKTNRTSLLFMFFESKLYYPKNQLRFSVTKQVVRKNAIKQLSYTVTAQDRLGQALEILSLGSYATFYLALLNNINPNLIPWVDYFKRQLDRQR
ncbi:MAG: SIS domain-containing protein [Candidatus Buchananbacteria bacterium]|nr:SIS domain-containing protein [Candidatus Buchananbacteria bacterium]